jgi:hypothetical protein
MCNNKQYFAPIWDEVNCKAVLMSAFKYFESLDITTFIQEPIPDTEFKREMKRQNLSNAYRFIIAKLNEMHDERVLPLDHELSIKASDLYGDYERWCMDTGEKRMMVKTLWSKLKDIGCVSKQIRIHGSRKRWYKFTVEDFQDKLRTHMKDDRFSIIDE